MTEYTELIAGLRDCAKHTCCSALPATERAADAIEELLAAAPHWISVEERLPEPRTVVLLFSHEGTFVGYMHDDKRFTVYASSYPERPTHWMPLPKAPKEVER